jgi:hypothetical protein
LALASLSSGPAVPHRESPDLARHGHIVDPRRRRCHRPAGSQLLVYDIVGPERLPSAIRLNATSRYLAILLGPAVGGGLTLLLGPGYAS